MHSRHASGQRSRERVTRAASAASTARLIGWSLLLAPLACSGGCDRTPAPPAPSGLTEPPSAIAPTPPFAPVGDGGLAAAVSGDAGAPPAADAGPPPPYPGPYFTVTTGSTGIYAQASADRTLKVGYARSGGRVPVFAETVAGDGCAAGWYRLVEGGYICSSDGSIDEAAPQVRLAPRRPDLRAPLPYPYARNAQNGTPLYSSVPSKDQIAAYESYQESSDSARRALEGGSAAWWQRKEAALNGVRLADLDVEPDGVLGRRMVKGFYIAIDNEFEWTARTWYKTTKALIAPKDRFVPVEASTFQGVSIDSEHPLPVAWVYARDSRPTYAIDDTGKVKPVGTVARFTPIHLEGDPVRAEGHEYMRSREGFWVRSEHVRIAQLSSIPVSVQPEEHWIHVDLYSQTLVAFIGATPVYATLVSSGKESPDEEKDHRTPPGEWNIREKHITTTMDGDGTAAGDLPYSIEDVPYVMYFRGSYALHAAFWHRNYGVRMSHGCINLAPLDAKYLFFFTGPSVREGWHGAWAGNGQTGSRIIIDGPVREPTRSAASR